MGKYTNSILTKDEKINYEAKIHWAIYLKSFFVFIFFIYLISIQSELAMYAFAFSLAFGIDALIKQKTSELTITDKRVVAKFGWIKRKTFEILLTKVEGAQIDQSIDGRILGYADVTVKGTGSGIAPVPFISKPEQFRKELDTLLHTN